MACASTICPFLRGGHELRGLVGFRPLQGVDVALLRGGALPELPELLERPVELRAQLFLPLPILRARPCLLLSDHLHNLLAQLLHRDTGGILVCLELCLHLNPEVLSDLDWRVRVVLQAA